MNIPCAKKKSAGTTLVEVVVAVAILAIMAAGIMGSLGYGFLATELARENQRATQVILEKAEIIRLYNWEQVISNGFIPKNFTNVYDPQGAEGQQGVTYYGELLLTNFPFSTAYSTNLRQLTITLNWTTAGKIPRTRNFTTAIAKDGQQPYAF